MFLECEISRSLWLLCLYIIQTLVVLVTTFFHDDLVVSGVFTVFMCIKAIKSEQKKIK